MKNDGIKDVIFELSCTSCTAELVMNDEDILGAIAQLQCEYCKSAFVYILPTPESDTVFNQEGQTVNGIQVNGNGGIYANTITAKNVVQGSQVNGIVHVDGDFVGGDKIIGDKVGGERLSGDKIVIGNISGQKRGIAIGRGATSVVQINYNTD